MTDERDWLRLAFLALPTEKVERLLHRYGGPGGVLGAGGFDAPEAGECRAMVDAARCEFDLVDEECRTARFDHVADPPRWLFRRGRLPEIPLIAIVGTRSCTEYGRSAAHEMGAACAAAGWGVVSGLARGIDTAAHRGTLRAGGSTVAVLGCGPDVAYPRQNAGLFDEIAATGALLTEYPPGAAPLPWRFPARNRIISALARAVVVVESGATGGSLSTAARAIAQGRPVFALPGDVDRPASEGCNRLIRDGAIPVLGPEDLVMGLSLLPPGR